MSNECATESVDPATGAVDIGDSGPEELSLAEVEGTTLDYLYCGGEFNNFKDG